MSGVRERDELAGSARARQGPGALGFRLGLGADTPVSVGGAEPASPRTPVMSLEKKGT